MEGHYIKRRALNEAETAAKAIEQHEAANSDELRADMRARAERAEHLADTYRAELDRLRAVGPEMSAAEPRAKPVRRGTRGQAAQPRTAADQ